MGLASPTTSIHYQQTIGSPTARPGASRINHGVDCPRRRPYSSSEPDVASPLGGPLHSEPEPVSAARLRQLVRLVEYSSPHRLRRF